MLTVSPTRMPSLQFKVGANVLTQKMRAQSGKIGWIHTLSDKDNASFSLTIKDALGRVKFERHNCTSQTKEFGELVNLPTSIGEELEVEVSNVKNADELNIFLN